RRIAVHAGDRGPAARSDDRRLAGGGKARRRRDPGARGGRRGGALGALDPGSGREPRFWATSTAGGGSAAGGGVLGGLGAGAGLQRGDDADWTDVQHGALSDDFLRLRVLPLERAEQFPAAPEAGAAQSAGLCERGAARNARAAISAHRDGSRDRG